MRRKGSGLALSFFERRLGGFEPELYFYLSTGKTPVARGRGEMVTFVTVKQEARHWPGTDFFRMIVP